MRASTSIRVGAVAGWVAFVGIVGGLIVLPAAIAGQPPTAATPSAAAMAYFAHRDLVVINALLAVFAGGLPIVPFGLGLRALLGPEHNARAALVAEIGFLLLLATIPIYVVSGALGAALSTPAVAQPTVFAPLHELYQLLYNGAADVLEGAWIGTFALAALLGSRSRSASLIGWLGIALGASRWIKAFVAVGGVSDAVVPISGVLFVAWFLTVLLVLTARAFETETTGKPIATAAGAV